MTRHHGTAAQFLAAALLAGCKTPPQSTAMPADVREQGLALKRALPSKMPGQSKPLAGSQPVLVPTESAAGLVVPEGQWTGRYTVHLPAWCPTMLLARGAAVLQDGTDHIIVRIAGGLMYGVHYLRKDQIHTLDRKP